jgi:hypothetical protein
MTSPTHGPPLARLLDATADAVLAVRSGRSLTDVLARVAPELRPGVQSLSFHALRWLGSTEHETADWHEGLQAELDRCELC